MVTTPALLTCTILDFCREIAPDSSHPMWLDVRPYRGARAGQCFDNVSRLVRLSGGEALFGWLIWTWPGAFLEAEHHCVLRCNDGRIRDVTPQEERRVLFLPDPASAVAPHEFARPNRRKAIAADSAVNRYLACFERRDALILRHLLGAANTSGPKLAADLAALEVEALRVTAELLDRTSRRGFQSKCA